MDVKDIKVSLPLLQTWHVGNATGRHAVYTLIQCTPLLVEKAGVVPDVTFRIRARKQERVQARYPLWIWNPWGRTHKVQNRSNQWLHKMELGPDKKFKKKKKKSQPGVLLLYCVLFVLNTNVPNTESSLRIWFHLTHESHLVMSLAWMKYASPRKICHQNRNISLRLFS